MIGIKPKCDLTNVDGNTLSILARVRAVLKVYGYKEEVSEIQKRLFREELDYAGALNMFQEYVDFVNIDKMDFVSDDEEEDINRILNIDSDEE